MRLWSIHPRYLDGKGLVALWREALLAECVIRGITKGYTRHPQLVRFRLSDDPRGCINYYLSVVYEESERRGYSFDGSKIPAYASDCTIPVTKGQVEFERSHLLAKLKIRDPERYMNLLKTESPAVHPLFSITEGGIEAWEKT
jgi:hypothetical protein